MLAHAPHDGDDVVLPRCVADVVPLLTARTLHAYAQAVAAASVGSSSADVQQQQQGGSSSHAGDGGAADTAQLLAPLEVLHGKTFVSAVGIALHDAEPIVRYVEQHTSSSPAVHAGSGSSGSSNVVAANAGATATTTAALTLARCVYRVGQYTLLSPYYCPCTAYMYQSVRRRATWCCKHLLALQLVLALEQAGVTPANLRIRLVNHTYFQSLLVDAL